MSAGQYVVVITMARLLREHPEWTIDDALTTAQALSDQVHRCFVPDTLEFLRAGGRVSNATAISETLLKIHPCIEILNGYLKATKKQRGNMKKIVPRLISDYIAEQNLDKEELWLIQTPGLSEEIMKVAEQTAYDAGVKKVTWVPTGGVITCHDGHGAFGMVGLAKDPDPFL